MEKDDELMAVLLGEPSPASAGDRADRYAAAERDMAAVREELRWIGNGLAQKAAGRPESAPMRGRRAGRRGLFALAASVAVALLGTSTAYLVAQNGAVEGGSAALLTYEGLIACSSTVAEGTVERVEPVGGNDRYRIVLDVDRYYKPARGARQLAFTDEGANVPAYYRTGAHMLVLVSSLLGEGPESYRAGDPSYGEGRTAAGDALEEGRLSVERALPGARGLTCDGGG
ncbi:hypothetical protein [Streptomyces acidicola]|uniref:hypothetical protein n=1 Tax=Streptomyces acidicola TaxID=2596892 RepID=UPI00343CACD8